MTPRPPRRAALFTKRDNFRTRDARRATCDHDYRLQETGRTKGSMRCVHCGHIMPNKGSEPT